MKSLSQKINESLNEDKQESSAIEDLRSKALYFCNSDNDSKIKDIKSDNFNVAFKGFLKLIKPKAKKEFVVSAKEIASKYSLSLNESLNEDAKITVFTDAKLTKKTTMYGGDIFDAQVLKSDKDVTEIHTYPPNQKTFFIATKDAHDKNILEAEEESVDERYVSQARAITDNDIKKGETFAFNTHLDKNDCIIVDVKGNNVIWQKIKDSNNHKISTTINDFKDGALILEAEEEQVDESSQELLDAVEEITDGKAKSQKITMHEIESVAHSNAIQSSLIVKELKSQGYSIKESAEEQVDESFKKGQTIVHGIYGDSMGKYKVKTDALPAEEVEKLGYELPEKVKKNKTYIGLDDGKGTKFAIEADDNQFVAESAEEITESKISSDSDFVEYGEKVLKKAHGDNYDQSKADKTLQGILKDADGDYGKAVGALTNGLKEEGDAEDAVDESSSRDKGLQDLIDRELKSMHLNDIKSKDIIKCFDNSEDAIYDGSDVAELLSKEFSSIKKLGNQDRQHFSKNIYDIYYN